MKTKIIFLTLILIIIAVCIISVSEQKVILINTSFLNIYRELGIPQNWKNWRPDLNKAYSSDSGKFIIKNDSGSFIISYPGNLVRVKSAGTLFTVNEQNNNNPVDYSFFLIPDKTGSKTSVMVSKNTKIFNYLIDKLRAGTVPDTHIAELKNYMETDSLMYGYKIFKTRVPEAYLVVMRKKVTAQDKFIAAQSMLNTLRQFIVTKNAKQTQPLIAQFLPKLKDSALVYVGLFINKEVRSANGVLFSRMPKGSPLYAAKYTGQFNERQKAYNGLHQYFSDHRYQQPVLPFETYLDNKLPASDTDKVRLQVNFSSSF